MRRDDARSGSSGSGLISVAAWRSDGGGDFPRSFPQPNVFLPPLLSPFPLCILCPPVCSASFFLLLSFCLFPFLASRPSLVGEWIGLVQRYRSPRVVQWPTPVSMRVEESSLLLPQPTVFPPSSASECTREEVSRFIFPFCLLWFFFFLFPPGVDCPRFRRVERLGQCTSSARRRSPPSASESNQVALSNQRNRRHQQQQQQQQPARSSATLQQ